jgi:acyl-homoserine lactone acylase PvdQ
MRRLVAFLAVASALVAPGAARAQLPIPVPLPPGGGQQGPQPQPYGTGDFGGFHDVLPPGSSGLDNAAQLAQFEATGARPAHNDDQRDRYGDLVYATPIGSNDLERWFKDATFGVKPEDVESTESPRSDVTIVRDKFGVPHIYGTTREGTEFGIGYATAEDRLFFIDVLRHVGRAELSAFVGGNPANRDLDRQIWTVGPYTEDDLQRQVNARPTGYEQESDRLRADLNSYTAGINQYISEARLNPLKMPAEYAAIGRPQGPDDWKPTDTVAAANLVGAIFGNGGGRELLSALILRDAQARFGQANGWNVWRDFRDAEDPSAPTTVRGKSFPYPAAPKNPVGMALPDPGSVKDLNLNDPSTAKSADRRSAASQLAAVGFPSAASNALIVGGGHTVSGHPIAVFGPQTAYFSPEILMEQDIHGPGLDAKGVAFPGTNVYVQLGHGQDYAWSATTAAQDITDTFAVPLCGPAAIDSDHYMFHGQCLQMETLTRTNSWQPNAGDPTPAGTETYTTQRTKLGLVYGRGTVGGKPVAYTRLRSTYLHETDSGLGFSYFNDPSKIHGPADFQHAASLIGYAFNWFYVDSRHSGYFNSGANPVRADGTWPDLPIMGEQRYEWKKYDPDSATEELYPFGAHAQAVDQDWMTSWNNKEAPGTRASDSNWGYGPTYRSKLLDDRISAGIANGRKMTLAELVNAMEDAGTVDLRCDSVLPWALRLLGTQQDPAIADALAKLRAWQQAGCHRVDRNHDGTYEDSGAIRILDAWWPLWVRAEFEPSLGKPLFDSIQEMIEISNDPNNHGQHLGSAWQHGWYGYAIKDLRAVLAAQRAVRKRANHHHRRARTARSRKHRKRRRGSAGPPRPAFPGAFSRLYCGGGNLSVCRSQLAGSLRQALTIPADRLYADPICDQYKMTGSQWCYDSVYFRPLGAMTQPLIHWINRPTYQQADEIQGQRP